MALGEVVGREEPWVVGDGGRDGAGRPGARPAHLDGAEREAGQAPQERGGSEGDRRTGAGVEHAEHEKLPRPPRRSEQAEHPGRLRLPVGAEAAAADARLGGSHRPRLADAHQRVLDRGQLTEVVVEAHGLQQTPAL